VITDRFPLKDFLTMEHPMDGPRLNHSGTKLASYFSRIERYYYGKIIFPDRVFVLQVSVQELRRRKNNLDLSVHRMKAKAVNSIKANGRVILLNANRPYTDVLLELKRRIWEIL
jgi:hypothetical protein